VVIVSGKRAAWGNPYERRIYTDSDESDSESDLWRPPYQSPSAYHYVGSTSNTAVDTLSGGSESPPSLGETEAPSGHGGRLSSGSEPSWFSQVWPLPGTTSGNQQASSSKSKSVSWGPVTKVHFYDPSSSADVKLDGPETTTENNPTKSVSWAPTKKVHFYDSPYPKNVKLDGPKPTTENNPTKSVSWGHTTKVHFYDSNEDGLPHPPGREGYLAKVAKQPQLNSFVNKFKTYFGSLKAYLSGPRPNVVALALPPGRDGHLAKTAAQQPPLPEIEAASSSSNIHHPPETEPEPEPELDGNAKIFDIFDKIKFGARSQRASDTVSIQ
jgi:hypothetical protein